FIVRAYTDKTMNLMFSYPISRKMILGSKMAAVWIFNFTALVLSKIIIYVSLVAAKRFTYISAESIALGDSMFYVQILVDSAVMISISFVALPVGMYLKSSKAAIIAGVVIVCLTQGNIGSYTLIGNVPFYTVLMAISAISVFFALYRVETKDV
ncbi:MAG: ABC transporter permease, partial [Lachnospiraceae bacterium]|nr:ABC transporter permease [Lachnospiraceae bacterium]